MTVHTLGAPAELRRWLESRLPRHPEIGDVTVKVTPRDASFRKCPAYLADYYEVQAFYVKASAEALAALDAAMTTQPGVYAVTRVIPEGETVTFSNTDWPAPLGTDRRDRKDLRAQVIALLADPPPNP